MKEAEKAVHAEHGESVFINGKFVSPCPVTAGVRSCGEFEMDTDTFWQIVDDVAAISTDPDEKWPVLKQKLEALSGADVYAFDKILTAYRDEAYRWDVWAVAAVIAGGHGCSSDSFDDFRYTQIFRGRAAFERLLADPDSLADEPFTNAEAECFFEGFQYVPDEVCQEKTDFCCPEDTYVHPEEPVGIEWEDHDLPKICPKTWAKYGWEIDHSRPSDSTDEPSDDSKFIFSLLDMLKEEDSFE